MYTERIFSSSQSMLKWWANLKCKVNMPLMHKRLGSKLLLLRELVTAFSPPCHMQFHISAFFNQWVRLLKPFHAQANVYTHCSSKKHFNMFQNPTEEMRCQGPYVCRVECIGNKSYISWVYIPWNSCMYLFYRKTLWLIQVMDTITR